MDCDFSACESNNIKNNTCYNSKIVRCGIKKGVNYLREKIRKLDLENHIFTLQIDNLKNELNEQLKKAPENELMKKLLKLIDFDGKTKEIEK